jgi:predicted phage terminase large subunit-like protein
MRNNFDHRRKRTNYHKAVARQEINDRLYIENNANLLQQTERDKDLEKLKQLLSEEEYYQSEDSLYQYLKSCWKYICSGEFKDGWYIEAVCDHVQACLENQLPGNSLIVSIPPRHLKSSICSVAAPTWLWGPANKPQVEFLSFSHNQKLSTRDALKSRRLIESTWYQDRWGDRFELQGDQNAKTKYENNHMGVRSSSSVGAGITGEGYDVLTVDDPIDAKLASSDAKIEEVIEWWSQAITSRGNDPKTARRIVIMQRVHQKDLVGYIEETEIEDWTVLKIPMEYNQHIWTTPLYWWQDKRTQEGEILSPDRFDRKQLNIFKKKLGQYGYSAQYQQDPIPNEGGVIRDNWFRYWEHPQPYEMIWSSWDLAQDDGKANDYTVGTVWAKKGCDRFLLDMFRGQWDINEQAKQIVYANRRYPAIRVNLIENKANGHAVHKLLRDPVQIQKIHGYAVPGITMCDPKKMGGDKSARLKLCSTEFSAGSVLFPNPVSMPWVEQVKKELCGFPKYRTDDICDSVSQAINWASQFGGSFDDVLYPQTLIEAYEQKVRERESQTATEFEGMVTARGLKSIFLE